MQIFRDFGFRDFRSAPQKRTMSRAKRDSNQNRLGGKNNYREMTVAQIRERQGTHHVQIAFLESARLYRLLRPMMHCWSCCGMPWRKVAS